MCGRINLVSAPHVLAERFYLDMVPDLVPRYNVAPGQDIAGVVPRAGSAGRWLRLLRWGLEPAWKPDGDRRPPLINARAETVADKPAFRDAFARRRCLVPVNGFYEWKKGPRGAQPWLFRRRDADVFALAGIWEPAPRDGPRRPDTCAILTTGANATMRAIHHRMPVILPAADWQAWLDVPPERADELTRLLRPAPADLLLAHPVSRRVNRPAFDEPACLEPVRAEDDDQLELFG